MTRLLRIGTRGSKLALAQANEVKTALEKVHAGLTCELVILKTSGDDFTAWKRQAAWKSKRGLPSTVPSKEGIEGRVDLAPLKGLFVKEIEEALLKGEIELAVHSVKDLQAELPEGLILAAILPRKDPRDALVTREPRTLSDLPAGTSVGVSSLRRQAQLKRIRRDLDLIPIRGNVDTRLRKLDSGEYGALILAACGLIRLGLEGRISQVLDPSVMLPAVGQGALGVEVRADREEVLRLVKGVEHPDSRLEVQAERSLLKALGGGCQVPIGALAQVQGENLTLTAAVLSPDGLRQVRKQIFGPKGSGDRLGVELASHLRAEGADRLLYGNWEKSPVVGEGASG